VHEDHEAVAGQREARGQPVGGQLEIAAVVAEGGSEAHRMLVVAQLIADQAVDRGEHSPPDPGPLDGRRPARPAHGVVGGPQRPCRPTHAEADRPVDAIRDRIVHPVFEAPADPIGDTVNPAGDRGVDIAYAGHDE